MISPCIVSLVWLLICFSRPRVRNVNAARFSPLSLISVHVCTRQRQRVRRRFSLACETCVDYRRGLSPDFPDAFPRSPRGCYRVARRFFRGTERDRKTTGFANINIAESKHFPATKYFSFPDTSGRISYIRIKSMNQNQF